MFWGKNCLSLFCISQEAETFALFIRKTTERAILAHKWQKNVIGTEFATTLSRNKRN